MAKNLQRWAKGYAERGAYVFPCHLDKSPITAHGFKDASRDPQQIQRWWVEHPDASIGVACGASRWFVLDVDADKGGFDSFAQLQHDNLLTPDDLATFTTRTGSGGYHVVWTMPDGVTLGNSAGKLGKGLDTRGEGGYVIVPPSDHPSGNAYKMEINKPPQPMPQSLIDLLIPPVALPGTTGTPITIPSNLSRTLQRSYERVANAAQGTRNDTLNRASFYLFHLVREGKLAEGEVRETLEAAAIRAGLERRETAATIQSAYRGAMTQ